MRGWLLFTLLWLGAASVSATIGAVYYERSSHDPVLAAAETLREFGVVWRANLAEMAGTPRITVTPQADGQSVSVATPRGNAPYSSDGSTQGATVSVAKATADALIGDAVLIELDVTRPKNNPEPVTLALAYATQTHGSTGWIEIPVRSGRARYSVAVTVPDYPVEAADGADVIGLVGDFGGNGETIELHEIMIRRLDD